MELGPDLWALVQDVDRPLLRASRITTMPSLSSTRRACFRLDFSDGTTIKGRCVHSLADADRIETLSALLDRLHFPRVLARHGRALLEAWVPGTPLPSTDTGVYAPGVCGRLQAELHRLTPPSTGAHLRRRPGDWEMRLDRLLNDLVTHDALEVSAAQEAVRLALLYAPPTATAGVCHTDLCAENIVIDTSGTIVVIDNEHVTIDAYEYDLARTWYRWPMTRQQQRAYAEGYGRHEHSARFADHFLHWALLAVVASSAVRVKLGAASACVPLGLLRGLLRSHGRDEAFPRLLSRS